MMRLIVGIGLLALTAAASADVVISGGKKGGSYAKYAANLAKIVKGRTGMAATAQASGGSLANVQCVANKECAVGLTQADALAASGRASDVEVLGALGRECVYIAYNVDGRVTDEDHLQDKMDPPAQIAVGSAGSGSQASWDYMTQLEEAYKASGAVYSGGNRSLSKVVTGKLDAFMFVTDPSSAGHKLIAAVAANKKLKFMDVDDSDLNDKLPDGTAVYEFDDIDVPGALWDVETICTPLLVIADPDASEDVLEVVAGALLNNVAAIKGGTP